MAWTRSMTRNQKHDNGAPSTRKKPKTFRSWSDLNHDVLNIIMMQLGFGDYYSFSGVCKSWRLLAHSNKSKFIASRPPMAITISTDSNAKAWCYLEDFEGRKFKTIIDYFSGDFIGLTCGYLIFFTKTILDFWLYNPITRKQLHFPHFPYKYHPGLLSRAILVFSPSLSKWVFVVLSRGEIWFCIEGKGVWKPVPYSFFIHDLHAFKWKIYTLTYDIDYLVAHERGGLCELRLNQDPEFTLLEIRNLISSEFFTPRKFVSSCDRLYLNDWISQSVRELDVGELKWVKPCEKTLEESETFVSDLTLVAVAVKQELWADPRSRSHGRYASFFNNHICRAKMWYFPYECINVNHIDE